MVLYGGTFDPPHAGHSACVRHVKQLFPSAQVVILPNPETMQPGGELKKMGASFAQRLQMCQLAFQVDEKLPGISVSDLETQLTPPYYTVNLLQRFIAAHPGQRVALLMGMDQFRNFSSWYESKAMLALSDLVVVGREAGGDYDLLREVIVQKFAYSFHLHAPTGAAQIQETGRAIYAIDQYTSAASSSQIRTMLRAGERPPQDWLSTSVAQYIEKWALYK